MVKWLVANRCMLLLHRGKKKEGLSCRYYFPPSITQVFAKSLRFISIPYGLFFQAQFSQMRPAFIPGVGPRMPIFPGGAPGLGQQIFYGQGPPPIISHQVPLFSKLFRCVPQLDHDRLVLLDRRLIGFA